VFVAEIGDITRLARPAQLTSWAGLTPRHHESDTTLHRGRITKQGSRLVRWAAVEAVQRIPAQHRLGAFRDQVGARRGRNIGVVAAARELTELIHRTGLLRAARRTHPPPGARRVDPRSGRVTVTRTAMGAGRGSHDPRPARRGRPS
jgi:hypothetical protein